jgi:hypothetical protein
MILFAVASPQDRLGDQRKEKIPQKLSELIMSKQYHQNFMAKLGKKHPEKQQPSSKFTILIEPR